MSQLGSAGKISIQVPVNVFANEYSSNLLQEVPFGGL